MLLNTIKKIVLVVVLIVVVWTVLANVLPTGYNWLDIHHNESYYHYYGIDLKLSLPDVWIIAGYSDYGYGLTIFTHDYKYDYYLPPLQFTVTNNY